MERVVDRWSQDGHKFVATVLDGLGEKEIRGYVEVTTPEGKPEVVADVTEPTGDMEAFKELCRARATEWLEDRSGSN